MPVATRSATRRTTPSAEPSPSTKSKAAKTKTTCKRKAAEVRPDVPSHGAAPMSCYEDRNPRWQAVYAKHPPLKVLPNEYLPHLEEGAEAPHFLYGWAFNRAWTLEIARRRRLSFNVAHYFRRHFGGCKTFNFGDVTEDHLNLPSLRRYLGEVAFEGVCSYVRRETHFRFTVHEPPVSDKWNRVFALWTNYNMRESYRRFQITATWAEVRDFMNELMNEGLPPESDRSEPMWWWSFDNHFRL